MQGVRARREDSARVFLCPASPACRRVCRGPAIGPRTGERRVAYPAASVGQAHAASSRPSKYIAARARRLRFQPSSRGSLTAKIAACSASRRLFLPRRTAGPPWRSPKLRSSRTASCHFRVLGDNRTGVSGGTQVLRRIEAERRDRAERAGAATAEARSMCLGCILHDGETVLAASEPIAAMSAHCP